MNKPADAVQRGIRRVQDQLLRLLGSTTDHRTTLVKRMLHRDASEATSYWLQLLVATGIATLGLVVGSTAVIIGAMLVAPLMTPILGLAMGLAAGGPFLVLRSIGRVLASLVAAVSGAALITWLLPFHELNAELLARTSPTVLDLVTAGFCALAGVYASLRPGSDTVATAAGTSIGISLVPPLCACGYGVGSGDWRIASGAGLLFLTNFVAIVVVGGLAFAILGFGRVFITDLENAELDKNEGAPVTSAIARRLAIVFATRAGRALRILMPLAFLAAVYVPLVRALHEIGWQVRVKGAVASELTHASSPIVQSRSRVEHHQVDVSVVIVGNPSDAKQLKDTLDRALRREAGVTPHVEVYAVADASAVAGIESTLASPPVVAAPAPPPPPPIAEQLDASRANVREQVNAVWPANSAGAPLAIGLETTGDGSFALRIRHLGAPLGADGLETLRKTLEARFAHPCVITDLAIPATPLTRDDGDLALVGRVADAVRLASDLERIHVCFARPPAPTRGKPSAADVELRRALDSLLQPFPRVTEVESRSWEIRFVEGACPSTPSPPTK